MAALTKPFFLGHTTFQCLYSILWKRGEHIHEVQMHSFVHGKLTLYFLGYTLSFWESPLITILSIVPLTEKSSLDHLGLKREPASDPCQGVTPWHFRFRHFFEKHKSHLPQWSIETQEHFSNSKWMLQTTSPFISVFPKAVHGPRGKFWLKNTWIGFRDILSSNLWFYCTAFEGHQGPRQNQNGSNLETVWSSVDL